MTVIDRIHQTQTESTKYAERDRQRICRPNPRIPLVLSEAKGVHLYDISRRKILDLTSGWNVANTGWNHPEVISAVANQLTSITYAPPWCTHVGRVEYAERLCEAVGDDYRVYGVATGSEAVEAALKVARRATGRHVIVGFKHAYHGGTLGAMLAGGIEAMHGVDISMTSEHRHAPIMYGISNREEYTRQVIEVITAPPHPAAVILEPAFTNPGVLYADRDFYLALQAAAHSVGALLIMDEVGTGFGRTGKLFGFQHWDIKPDLIAVSKGIGSGVVPIAALLLRQDLGSAITGPGYSSTYGWTPMGCAAADATLTVLHREQLCGRASELGAFGTKFLLAHLKIPSVKEIRGIGLEMGIELTTPDKTLVPPERIRVLTDRLLARGIFVEPSSFTSTVLLMPPLVISEQQWSDALSIIVEEIIHWTATNAQ